MPVQNKPIIHARDHEPGGADPIRFPVTIPGNYEEMARAWGDAYWKLEETELGSAFLDELPGHHDLYTTSEGGLTRGVSVGPAEPGSTGIYLNGGSMVPHPGSAGPMLALPDLELGVDDTNRVGFFAVCSLDPPGGTFEENYMYGLAGVMLEGETDPQNAHMRWLLEFVPQYDAVDDQWFHVVRGWVQGGGDVIVATGTTPLGPLLSLVPYGVEFDVGFNYTGTTVELYLNGLLEASDSSGSPNWSNPDREGTFRLGAMNRTGSVSDGWHNFRGTIGTAMLSTDAALTSGQMKNLHDGEPTVGGLPGEITPEQHPTIPTGDLHPEYLREAEVAAKGDLLAGTGAGTVDNLSVGTNGQALVADSTAAAGVKWATPTASGAAGGVLSGTYPNPGFAEDMATQAELDALVTDPALDTAVWMPLTTVTGGVPELVWDADDSLIPTLEAI